MRNTTTRIGLTLALALVGLGGAGRAQEVSGEPPTSEATPELIAPEIDGPALPSMTEEAAQEPTPGAAGSSAFNDLTPPDMSAPRSASEYRTCPDREERPAWAEKLEGREAVRSLLLSEIYRARSYEQIVATGDCSCAVKAPSWAAAEAEYQENYAALDLVAVREARGEFQRLSGSFHHEARRICRAQGNW
ncbi:hypothetical protein ACFPOC_11870 [Rubellimicrobium aerolatum]|uniref:DUF1311 domain-containing protein n=1 Tax=Rubellimicrobium aerolatum TaxID=490979 RepID=A0ABW0SE22_9RHOB